MMEREGMQNGCHCGGITQKHGSIREFRRVWHLESSWELEWRRKKEHEKGDDGKVKGGKNDIDNPCESRYCGIME